MFKSSASLSERSGACACREAHRTAALGQVSQVSLESPRACIDLDAANGFDVTRPCNTTSDVNSFLGPDTHVMRYADLERAKELALPPAPQQAPPWLTGLSPSAAVVVKRTTGAKLGHAMLDVASALLIAGAMNWSYIPPGRDSLDLWKVFDFRHLKPNLSLHGESSSAWESAGACPRNWTIISFRHVFGWTGEPSWAKTVSYMRRKTERESGPMCIVCQGSVRVMLHHYRSWELYGMVRQWSLRCGDEGVASRPPDEI